MIDRELTYELTCDGEFTYVVSHKGPPEDRFMVGPGVFCDSPSITEISLFCLKAYRSSDTYGVLEVSKTLIVIRIQRGVW